MSATTMQARATRERSHAAECDRAIELCPTSEGRDRLRRLAAEHRARADQCDAAELDRARADYRAALLAADARNTAENREALARARASLIRLEAETKPNVG